MMNDAVADLGPKGDVSPGAIAWGPGRQKPVLVPKQGSEIQLSREQS